MAWTNLDFQFPLIKLAKKLKEDNNPKKAKALKELFPLIKLAKKLKEGLQGEKTKAF